MPLDAGISQCTITYGVPKDFLGGDVITSLQLIPTHDITWAATGAPVLAFASNRSTSADVPGQFSVPHVDQDGFTDAGGNSFKNWAYTAIIRYRSVETGETREVKKNFAPLVGQTTIDLDAIVSGPISIPVTAPSAAVLSVDGATGIVSLSGKQNVSTLDADVATKAALPGSALNGLLTATYGPTAAPMQAAFTNPRFTRPKPTRNQPQITINTTFQTGHGYTANSGTWTADTAVFALGTQSIKTTATTTSSTFRKLAQPALDLSGKDFAALIKVDDPTLLSQIHLYLGKSSLASYEPVQAALGGISANSTILPNTWTWVYFSWADAGNPVGTPDRTAITDWQLRVLGNSLTPVTVWVNAVGSYPRRQAFPKGCVSFACDDGRLSQYTRMAPTLDKYGYGATAYVIVEALGTAAKMTYDQVKELEDFHRWEIGGHAYTSAAHNNGMTTLTLPDLDVELRNLRNWLQQGNHKAADLFAYPLGFDNPDVVDVVSRYFVNARQITRAPFQNADLDQPYRMRSNSMSSSDPLSVAKVWIDKAAANGTWLTITMHDIVDGTPAAGTEWNTADFQALVDYVAASGVEVMPVGAALDRIDANQPTPISAPIIGGTP